MKGERRHETRQQDHASKEVLSYKETDTGDIVVEREIYGWTQK
jgi:hypothetical protein